MSSAGRVLNHRHEVNVKRALVWTIKKSTMSTSMDLMIKRAQLLPIRGVQDDAVTSKMDMDRVVVEKDAVMACLMCHICENTMQEPTTITECLHAFCRRCIFDAAPDSCPVCGVRLGSKPLNKLKPDLTLDRLQKYFNSLLASGSGGSATSTCAPAEIAKDAAAPNRCDTSKDAETAAEKILICPKCKHPLQEPTGVTETRGGHDPCSKCSFKAALAESWPICNVNLQRIMNPLKVMQFPPELPFESRRKCLNSKFCAASSTTKETTATTTVPATKKKPRRAKATPAASSTTTTKRKRISLKSLVRRNNASSAVSLHPDSARVEASCRMRDVVCTQQAADASGTHDSSELQKTSHADSKVYKGKAIINEVVPEQQNIDNKSGSIKAVESSPGNTLVTCGVQEEEEEESIATAATLRRRRFSSMSIYNNSVMRIPSILQPPPAADNAIDLSLRLGPRLDVVPDDAVHEQTASGLQGVRNKRHRAASSRRSKSSRFVLKSSGDKSSEPQQLPQAAAVAHLSTRDQSNIISTDQNPQVQNFYPPHKSTKFGNCEEDDEEEERNINAARHVRHDMTSMKTSFNMIEEVAAGAGAAGPSSSNAMMIQPLSMINPATIATATADIHQVVAVVPFHGPQLLHDLPPHAKRQIWVHVQPATKVLANDVVFAVTTTTTTGSRTTEPPHELNPRRLASPYLRIKDGDMPVSVLKSYLMTKLSLNPEEETLDLLCHNIPLTHNTDVLNHLPLKALSFQWFSAQHAITPATTTSHGTTEDDPFVFKTTTTTTALHHHHQSHQSHDAAAHHPDVQLLLWDKPEWSPEVQPQDLMAVLSYQITSRRSQQSQTQLDARLSYSTPGN